VKKLRILFFPGLIGLMCLALFAQEPQGRGGQGGAPDQGAPGGAAGRGGGQRGGKEVDRREAAALGPKTFRY
jgi:hypothetical protein